MTGETKLLEKTFIAHIDSLEPILSWVRSYADITGFSRSDWKKIEVALEEALVNIIYYAYKKEKSGWIFLSFCITPSEKIEITLKDKGTPFDPENIPRKKPKTTSIEQALVGGLGLILIHNNMDEVHYERIEPYNVLKLTKYCPH